jgi:acyl-CoA-binding protein
MGPQVERLSHAEQLQYYGLYKQATMGDCCRSRPTAPPAWDVVARAKHAAWRRHEGMERVMAMQEYIDKVVQYEYVRSINGDDDDVHDSDADALEGDAVMDVVGMGNNVSTLVATEDEDDMAHDDREFPLHAAAREGRVEELERLLETGSDSNLLDPSGQTPLHLAADRGHVECVKALVLNGANVHTVDHDGISVLQAAVIGGDVPCCRLLLALGCDPHQADQDGDTPAHSAKDDKELGKIFVDHEKSPITLKNMDAEFVKQLEQKGIRQPKQNSMDVQQEIKNLDQPLTFDLDDDGDM